MKWCRLYAEIVDDPKMACLPDGQFRLFIELLCLAADAEKNGDTGLTLDQVSWRLRRKVDKQIEALLRLGVVFFTDSGTVSVTSWNKRQFLSDRSTERVRKHRSASAETLHETFHAVTETVNETPQNRVDKNREEQMSRRPRKTPLPDGFAVSARVKAWAKEKGFDRLQEHLEAFKAKALANGYKYSDWDSAFMEAIRGNWAKLPIAQPKKPAYNVLEIPSYQ